MALTTVLPSVLESVSRVSFSWYDYILFTLMLTLSAFIGIYFGCFGSKQSTTNEYLMGGKQMKVIPISVSLVASHISGIALLAVPADVYRYGAAYWLFINASIFVTFATIYVYLPVFYKLQITSTYEYLEKRFDNKNRMLASFLFSLSVFLYLPIVIYIPALAFSAATGINVHYVTPLVCGVCIFYTTLGGLKAVVWTDTLQFTVTIGAVVTVFILGLRSAGGFGAVWSDALEGHRLDIFDVLDFDPTKRDSFWIVTVGMSIGWIASGSIHQSCVQKYLSVPTLHQAKMCVVYFYVGISVVCSFSVFTGLIMYSKYAKCDPFTTGAVKKDDQLLPYYVMDVASHIPGLSGLFIAGVFCAALSTLSASLNCLAGTLYEDFVVKFIGHKDEKTSSNILKLLVIVTGTICTVLVLVIEKMGGILALAYSLAGVTAGPSLGMFTLGLLFPRATKRGAFYGSIAGLVFLSWIVVMAQYYRSQNLFHHPAKPTSIEGCNFTGTTLEAFRTTLQPFLLDSNYTLAARLDIEGGQNEDKSVPFFLFRISHYLYAPLGTIVTMVVGLLISYCFPNEDPPVHKDLLSPIIHWALSEEKVPSDRPLNYYDVNTALRIVTSNNEKEKDDGY